MTHIENLDRANSTLKIQIESLKEMLLSMSDIRDNETFKQEIEKEFTYKHNVPPDAKLKLWYHSSQLLVEAVFLRNLH